MLITPLFLLGFLGIALPWWLHRLETQTTEREKFSTTRFLEASKKRIHIQRKLKYLILMALRMAFLCLLALVFARPVFFDEPSLNVSDDTIHHVIVMDTSFSMHEADNLDIARELAIDIINGVGADDIASLYTASSTISTISEPSNNNEELIALVRSLEADNGRMDLGGTMSALGSLIEDSQGNISLHVISDFQQSAQALRFADMIPDVVNNRPVTLDIQQVVTQHQPNNTIETVVVENRNSISASVRSFNIEAGSRLSKDVVLSINKLEIARKPITISNSGIQLVEFQDVVFAEGDNRIDIALSPSDSFAEDDIRHTVFDNAPPAPVLLLTDNLASLGVTYISAALETAPRGYVVEAVDVAEFDPRIMQRYPWLIIEDIGIVNAALEAPLQNYISSGGSVLAAAGPSSTSRSTIPVLKNNISSVQLGPNGRPITLQVSRIDTSHPALNESAGWSNVNVRAVPIESTTADKVLIAQNARTPVLIERNIGAGRMMLLTTSLDNSASDLPVKPVFVTFMAELAQYLSNEKLLVKQQLADSYLQLSQSGGASGQVLDPDGITLLSLQDTTRNQDVLLNKTGYYQVFTPAGEVLVAVNPDIRESDLNLMPSQALQNWQNAVSGASKNISNTNTSSPVVDEAAEEIEIWKFFLILMALVVLAESLLGNRYLNSKTGTA